MRLRGSAELRRRLATETWSEVKLKPSTSILDFRECETLQAGRGSSRLLLSLHRKMGGSAAGHFF